MLLCLLMASCDVRPFSDFANDDSTEDVNEDQDDDDDAVPDPPAALDLELSANPSSIAVEVGFEATTQVNIGQRDPEGT
jgi:hypothetical protein